MLAMKMIMHFWLKAIPPKFFQWQEGFKKSKTEKHFAKFCLKVGLFMDIDHWLEKIIFYLNLIYGYILFSTDFWNVIHGKKCTTTNFSFEGITYRVTICCYGICNCNYFTCNKTQNHNQKCIITLEAKSNFQFLAMTLLNLTIFETNKFDAHSTHK